jgi:CDP-diacylglycerol---serine O-phosphatidyltransferase
MSRPRTTAADLMTIGNGVCGFLALVVLLSGPLDDDRLRAALALYGLGMLLDVLDGAVARRFGSSGLGATLDTICDTISFGLLPGALLVVSLDGEGGWRAAGIAAASLYVGGVILRLARFALHEAQAGHVAGRPFSGMPSPAGGNCVLAIVVLTLPAPVAVLGVAGVAYLLVADIPFPDKSRWGGVYVAALLAASFVALAGLIPLEVPAAAALLGLVPIAVLRAGVHWVHLLRPVGVEPHAPR